MAMVRSQGQQQADLMCTTNQAIAAQDSTSGHGYNGGTLVVYDSLPATGNTAAPTGVHVLATLVPAAQAFGAATAALPSVVTAGNIASVAISNTGTAAGARLCANADDGLLSTTERRLQFTCTAGGVDMSFNTLSLVAAGTLAIPNGTFTITSGG